MRRRLLCADSRSPTDKVCTVETQNKTIGLWLFNIVSLFINLIYVKFHSHFFAFHQACFQAFLMYCICGSSKENKRSDEALQRYKLNEI